MCPVHPYIKPVRSTDLVMTPSLTSDENCNHEVTRWLQKYRSERADKTPAKEGGRLQPVSEHDFMPNTKKPKNTKRGLTEELEQQENSPMKRRRLENAAAAAAAAQHPQPTPMQLFAHPPLSLLPSFVSSSPLPQQPCPKSPLKNHLPGLALLSSQRSLLEERLKTSPPRKQLSDITSTNNEQDTQARNALSALLAAAAAGNHPVVQPKSPVAGGSKQAPSNSFRLLRTPPRSPMKNLKPKKRWARALLQEEGKKKAVRRITETELPDEPQPAEASSSSSPPNSNEEDSLAMPIRWTEADNPPQPMVFRNSTGERRSPLSLQIATTLIAMSSESSDNNPVSSEPDCTPDGPLNLSKK